MKNRKKKVNAVVESVVPFSENQQEKLHQKLLTIPTTRLSELSLDKLLES